MTKRFQRNIPIGDKESQELTGPILAATLEKRLSHSFLIEQ